MTLTTKEIKAVKKAKSFLLFSGCLYGQDKNGVFFFVAPLSCDIAICGNIKLEKEKLSFYAFDSLHIEDKKAIMQNAIVDFVPCDSLLKESKELKTITLHNVKEIQACALFSSDDTNRAFLQCVYLCNGYAVATDARRIIYTEADTGIQENENGVLFDKNLVPYATDGDKLTVCDDCQYLTDNNGNIKAFSSYPVAKFPSWKRALFDADAEHCDYCLNSMTFKAIKEKWIKGNTNTRVFFEGTSVYQRVDEFQNMIDDSAFSVALKQSYAFDVKYMFDLLEIAKREKENAIFFSHYTDDEDSKRATQWKIGRYTAVIMPRLY